jgi:hypothetical protein
MPDLCKKYSFFINNQPLLFSNAFEIKAVSDSKNNDFCLTEDSKNKGSVSFKITNPIKVIKLRIFVQKTGRKSLFNKMRLIMPVF